MNKALLEMAWECPLCHRRFKNKNQQHTCMQRMPEEILFNKSPAVKKIYDCLLAEVTKLSHTQVSVVQNAVIIASNSTFLALKPKKDCMDIEFLLERAVDEFPIHKCVKVSKNRFAHFVRLERASEIDDQLIRWIHDAYATVNR
jgi:hypothetical protein